MSSRRGRRSSMLFAGLLLSLGWLGASAGAAHALQALPVTVTSSTNWAVATSLPPAGPSTTFSYGTRPNVPLMGDWDGNGTRTPGSYEAGVFKLSNALPPAGPAITIPFGDPRGFPVVGDFNGDGKDDLAVYRSGLWQIRVESGGTGSGGAVSPSNVTAYAGSWPSTIPVAGDWDGDGLDGIGRYTPLTGEWLLRQTPNAPDLPAFTYNPGVSPYAVVGDWDNDGDDTVGVRAGTSWLLNNQNDSSPADITFVFGLASDLPLVGGGTGANTPPAAVDDAATVAEDAAATAVPVLTNDTDPDGGPKSIASVAQPANGTVVITGGGTGLTYQPDPNYCNSPPGTSPDTFTYTLAPGGSSATVSMTVTCVDDPPVAVNNSAGVNEDDPAAAVLVLNNDTDIDGGPKTITSASDPANGTVGLTGGSPGAHTGLTYQPDPNYCNSPSGTPDTFTYTLNGGSSATVSMTVTCVDDAPVAVNDSATVAANAGATAVDVLANDTDVDGGTKRIASATDPANGTVVLTGGSPGAHTGLTYQPDANYCNSPPGTSPDTFSYTLTPGGASATVSMTVTCPAANDPPDVDNSAGALAYTENDPPTAIDTNISVTDVDSANLTGATVQITGNYAPGQDVLALPAQPIVTASFDALTGKLTLSGTATVAAYEAALEAVTYVHTSNAPSTATRTVTYQARDAGGFGAADTHAITITAVDDPPVAFPNSAGVNEDDPAAAVLVLGNDTDVDAGPKVIASATDPANGTVVLTGGSAGAHTGLTYQPDPNYCNSPSGTPDTFSYTLNGGSSATVSMTVTCVNDNPVVNTSAGSLAYTENAPATAIDSALTVTDVDVGASITGATVAITTNFAGAQDVLALSGIHPGISAGPQIGNTLTLSGTATPAAYQAALRSVTYANTSEGPSTLARTVTFTVTDNGALTGSDTRGIAVAAVDDAPVGANDSATVLEDASAPAVTVLTNDTDPDGGPKSIASVTQPANGTVVVTGGGTGLTYQPNANYCNSPPGTSPDTFSYTLNGGSSATVSMTVSCVNDNPVVNASAGSLAYTENAPAAVIDPGVTVTDADAGTAITGATAAITTNFAAGDVLALNGVHPFISAGTQIGNTLSLTGTATPAAYQAALRDVAYRSTSEGPSTLTRTVTFTVTDNTALSGSDTRGITVTAVNDPPTAVDDPGTTDEDTPLTVAAPGVLANDTDVDPGDTKTVVRLNGSLTLTGSTSEGGSVTINANGSFTYTPPSAFQAMSTGESDTDSFQYTMADGAGAQSSATVDLSVNGVSDAPTAVTDTFDAVGNTGLFVGTTRPAAEAGKVITGSVLTNDTDPDTPQASLVAEPVTNASTALGGTITIEADGNFTYQPQGGDTGTDTFTYRVCDASPCNSGTVATATGTLNLPIAGQVWYVRNNQAAGGDGTSDTPFDTLLEAETASSAGDTVYVFDGNNTTTNLNTGYVMEANERLIGESRPLSLDPDGGGSLPIVSLFAGTSGAQPMLTASNEDVIVLASNTLVDGVDVDPAGSGGGIAGGPGAGGGAAGDVTVQNVNVTDTGTAGTQPGIEMDGTSGVNRFTSVTVTNGGSATAIGVQLNSADRVLFANTATNTITTSGAKALDAAATNLLTSRWNDIRVIGSGSGGVRLNNTSGTPVLGDGAGTDLSLQTTSGATAALDIASSNNVRVNGGLATISATGGPAVDIRNSNGSVYGFDSVSSASSAGDGINLDTNLATPFTAITGAISNAAGIGVDVNGGGLDGDVSYGGQINDGPGPLSVEVTGRSGGAVTLSGNIADGPDAGGGIAVTANSAGSTTFSGTSKVLNTGAANAVSTSSNGPAAAGHAVSFTGGGLNIDTTSGAGFTAQTGGSVTVTGSANTIDTGTGNALFLDNTNIGASNVTFQRISANGAAVGIRANATGAVGRLIVTGSGGTCTSASTAGCSGGQLANLSGADNTTTTPSGTGIMLNNTLNPSFTRMWIHDASNYGIRGTNVAGFAMNDSVVNGSNGTSAATLNKDGSARFEELTGAVNMTNVSLSGGYFTNLMVDNTAGVLNATLDNVDSLALNATGGDDAVQFEGIGTSDMNVNHANSQITTASGDLFQYIGDGTGGGDLDFTNNTLTNNEPSINTGGGGVALVAGAKGAATMDVLNNTMRDSLTNALTIIKSADAAAGTNNLAANITGNSIGVAATPNSGSVDGDGMEITTFGDGSATFNVTNNNVRQYNSSGMAFVAGSGAVGTGQFNLNISGNAVGNPGTNPLITLLQGIRVDSGVAAGDTFATCVDFGPNSITGSGNGAIADFRLVASQSTTIRQPGYGGGATDAAAFAAFAAAQIGGGAQGTAVANPPATFSGTGTTCP